MLAAQKMHENSHTLQLITAEVIAKGDDSYMVKAEGQSGLSWHAKCASSFLFVPEIHDTVLLMAGEKTCFILHILQRSCDTPLQLRMPKALSIDAVDLHCHVDLLTLSGQSMQLHHQHVASSSETVELNWQQTLYQGLECQMAVDKASIKARLMDSCLDTFTLKAKRVLHWVEELKQQMLGRMHISVQKHYQLDCESVDIYSQKDVKIDAKQIHLG
jgi:hypothetical protein